MEEKSVPPRIKLHRYRPRGSGYLGRMLLADEYVVYIARLHWIIYDFGAVLIVLGVLLKRYGYIPIAYLLSPAAAVYVELPMTAIAYAFVGIGALYVFFTFIRHISTELVVTNLRVISKRGLIATRVFEANITKISSVDVEESILGRVLDYGTVTVRSSGQDIRPIDHVANPYRFYFHVMRGAELEIHPETGKAEKPKEIKSGEKKPEILSPPPPRQMATPAAQDTRDSGDDDDD